MASNKEKSIQRALNDLELGLFSSFDQAAAYYDVPKSTLAHRRAGRESVAKTNRISQRLTKEEEKVLIQYFRDLQRQNLCPNYTQIRRIIAELCRNKGDLNPLGKHYITRFVARHASTLKSHRPRAMDIKRLSALDPAIIERFFAEFERLRSEYSVDIEDTYNMDETGFQIGQITSDHVIYDPSIGLPIAPKTGNTQWTTVIECVGINRAIKPYIIHTGKAPEDHWFLRNQDLPDVIWAFSPKGWTDNELALDWLRRIFIPITSKQNKHSILILDNHESHTTGLFQYYCLQNRVHPLYLPAHASHKLQPLDVGPFSPLSAAYGRTVQEHFSNGYGTLNRATFTKLYLGVRDGAMTERNIRAGWKRTGIWPLNKQKLLEDPDIRNFGRTTPEYQPLPIQEGPNRLFSTPKKHEEFQELQRKIEAKVTPRTRRAVRKLTHAAMQEYTANQTLRIEVRGLRKRTIDEEVSKRSRRLRKERVQRSWDLEQVQAAREGRPPSRVRITHRTPNSLRICILSDKLE